MVNILHSWDYCNNVKTKKIIFNFLTMKKVFKSQWFKLQSEVTISQIM